MPFAHLHVHSQFTLLNGVNTPKEIAKAAKERGLDALALTDTCNFYGAVELFKACKENSLHYVLGSELWVDPRGQAVREGKLSDHAFQVVLLCEDEVGYRNLCALITRAIFDGLYYRPRVDLGLLQKHRDGLLCLTSGEWGPIRKKGDPAEGHARDNLSKLGEIFTEDRLFCEMMDHGLPWQAAWNNEVRRHARELGLKCVVTNDVRYVDARDVVVLDALNCIANATSLDDSNRLRPATDQQYLKSEAEMRVLFPNDTEALDLAHTLAHRTHFKFKSGIYYFPSSTPPDPDANADTDGNWKFFLNAFPPPRDFQLPTSRPQGTGNLNGYFSWYARSGLRLRLVHIPADKHDAYWARLEAELRMIVKMGFAAYLLIVAEFINWAKDRGIPVGPGRGSAAGSVATWAMRITDIDPIRFSLLFERFLNPERVSMPDIDVDFAQDRREEVIAHVREKYTPPLVAQIITYGKLQAKAALKDIARTCELTFQEADRIAKLIPNQLNITLADALKQEPKIEALCASDPRVRRVVTMAQQVEGITRQTGVHAAGVVVADRPLEQLVPLYRDGPDGGPVVQYDMKSAESVGLIKFDFLGLKTLDQIRDAVTLIERNTGETIRIGHVPEDDPVAFALLQKGDGLGVFQVESSGMRELLTRLKPSSLEDLVALVALYRPGPLSSGMVDDFIERKHGRRAVEYAFQELQEILGPTYGTIVYQEQVMQVAQRLAGYSLGEADLLRRAMGKKDANEMAKQRGRFVSGAIANGHDEQKVGELFDLLAKFAEYGFNKSHSAAYGYIAYQTAWLKAHHRAEFMAALMTTDAGDSDKILIYINDCRRAGLRILPPDIFKSGDAFDVPKEDRRSIRYGLCAIKGLGSSAIAAILEARKNAGGQFKDWMDFLQQVDFRRVNKKVLEVLIKSGSFDSFNEPRARLFAALEDAMAAAQDEQARKASGQVSLFGGIMARPTFRLPNVAEWPVAERMRYEKEALGLFLTGHPVEAYNEDFERCRVTPIKQLATVDPDKEASVCGMIGAFRVIKTKKGDKMAFASLEDLDGSVECVFFPEAFNRSQYVLSSDRPIFVKGKVERKEDGIKILADSAESMDDVCQRMTRKVDVVLPEHQLQTETIQKLQEVFKQNKGACTTRLIVVQPGLYEAYVRVPEKLGVAASQRLKQEVRQVIPEAEVRFGA